MNLQILHKKCCLLFIFISFLIAGCNPRLSAIQICSYDVEKQMQLWISKDGEVSNPDAFERRKTELLWSCIEAKGWVFNTERANMIYATGKSPGLVGQAKDPHNWSWGWFGLLKVITSTHKP
jgi:hypothetical protein